MGSEAGELLAQLRHKLLTTEGHEELVNGETRRGTRLEGVYLGHSALSDAAPITCKLGRVSTTREGAPFEGREGQTSLGEQGMRTS